VASPLPITDLSKLPGAEPDPKAVPTVVWGVIGIIVTIVIIFLCEILYYWTMQTEVEEKVFRAGQRPVDRLYAEQEWQIGYDHYDEERNLVAVPVDHAIGKVIAERAKGE